MEIVEIIQPSGKLELNKLNFLHNEIVSFLSRGVKLILIDFQDVIYLDSRSAISLQNTLHYVHDNGSKIYICSLNEQVKNTFQIANIEELFPPLENRQEFEEKILAFGRKME